MKTSSDNLTVGKLVIVIALLVFAVWLIKVVLFFLINLAASILTIFLYIILVYAIIVFSLSLYAYFSSERTPKIVKLALSFNHSVALSISYIFKFMANLLNKIFEKN